ncbi:MAG: SDR family NAD(P)-dependent oxidoreductase, partial [Cyanobacteriota bacterium]
DRIYRHWAGQTRPGDGSRPSNWIHLDDIVGAMAFAQDQGLAGIYNLVDDDHPPTREVVEAVCQTYQLPPVTWDGSEPATVRYSGKLSNQKIKDAGYELIHPHRII